MKINNIKIQEVHFMPAEFQPGILYVSKEFGIAGHLCACGCGNKVMTPLGKYEWIIKNSKKGVSVWPSIGNWQLQCKTHYIIRNGKIIWCAPMDTESIIANLQKDADLRKVYYSHISHSFLNKFKSFVKIIVDKIVGNKSVNK